MRVTFRAELDLSLTERYVELTGELTDTTAFADILQDELSKGCFSKVILPSINRGVEKQLRSMFLTRLLQQPLNRYGRRELSPNDVHIALGTDGVDRALLEKVIGDFVNISTDCRVWLVEDIAINEIAHRRYLLSRSLQA